MTVTEAVDLTIVRVDGRLTGAGVTELEGACRSVGRPLVLDLTNLMGGSDAGLLLLRRLASEGVHLLGASPYVTLLLTAGVPEPPATSKRRRAAHPLR